jgi:outer membrane protein OmpA-like peptidoglycan-associated protein
MIAAGTEYPGGLRPAFEREIMWIFTQAADWADGQLQRIEKILLSGTDHDDSHAWWGVRVGDALSYAQLHSTMGFASGFVDVLRLGDGIFKERSLAGWGHDGLRLIAILPIGRLSKMGGAALRELGVLKRVAAINELPSESICGWVSMKQALRQTLVKHAATLEDLMEAARGVSTKHAKLLYVSEIAEILRNAGAEVKTLSLDTGRMMFRDLEPLVRSQKGGVLMFAHQFETEIGQAAGVAAEGAHCLYAYINELGQFRIVDRSGEVAALSELEQLYPGISNGRIRGAIHIADAFIIRVLDEVSNKAVYRFALEVRSAFLGDKEDLDALYLQAVEGGLRALPYPAESTPFSPTDDSFLWIVGGPRDPRKQNYLQLTFHSNRSKFEPKQVMVLEQAWAKIRERLTPSRRQTVYIAGFSDSVGRDAANKHISWRRAEAVAKWFLDRNLLTRDKVRTQGWGKARPVATNSTREGQAQNRRVEIFLHSR